MSDANGEIGIAPGGFPLGVLPSPADERDYRYPAYGQMFATKDLPTEYTCPNLPPEIDDQGAVSSCVAHSLGLIKDWQEYAETKMQVRHSRQFIYAYRSNPFFYRGPGMIPREALHTLCKWGVTRETVWPGIVEFGKEVWPADEQAMREAAAPFRIAAYVSIDHRYIPEVKSAVYTTGPVLYCVPVYDNFIPDGNGLIPLPSSNNQLRGYHAMVIVGWRHGAWLARNSWGAKWGQSGYCWIPWDFPAVEVWGVTDATSERVKTLLLIEGSNYLWVNGNAVWVDRAPQIIEDRFYAVGRHLIEQLGGKVVDWSRYHDGPHAAKMWAQFEIREPPW